MHLPVTGLIAVLAVTWNAAAADFSKEDRAWWSFQPVQKPGIPAYGKGWAKNEIDPFIARKLATQKLAPAKAANARTLIRRVTFDLTGLPPSPAEVKTFLKASIANPNSAYATLVDRLLASPRFGERQARFWLDLVRYADSDGYNADHPRPEAWRYRNYVINSFNTDKPYDRFVREQIAGDEMGPGNREALTATMYLRHWIYEYNQRDVETQWSEILNDITDVTGDVFLAMGMQCARCHNHKFDSILQKDYFRLRAFFEPLQPREAMPVADAATRKKFAVQQRKWETATKSIRKKLRAIEQPVLLANSTKEGFEKFNDDIQAMIRKHPSARTGYEHQIAELSLRQIGLHPEKLPKLLKGEQKVEWEKLRAELSKHDALKPKPLPTMAFVASDVGPVAPPTRIPKKPRAGIIAPGFLTILNPAPARITPPEAALQSTGRRTALANWIVSPKNPLTARVIVNRLWQQHFGRGLAANPSDFGHLGEKPTHPELLDWLAARLVEDGWSLKKMHRLMVTSATYRMRSGSIQSAELADPENRLLWHYPIRRLDADQIHDAALAASGELNTKTGGAGVDLAKEPRRAVYGSVVRNKPVEMMNAFDSPDAISHAPSRNVTTTATQSLLMLNGEWMQARAEAFARRLEKNVTTDAARVTTAYKFAFGRKPTVDQLQSAQNYLQANADALAKSPPPKPEPIAGIFSQRIPSPAALLKPDSAQSSLSIAKAGPMPAGDFTVEAMIKLNTLYPNAVVRRIVSQWDNNKAHPGWVFGVTSTKSGYKPRNLILQLVGDKTKGDHGYEVIASNLRPELNKPFYVAVSVKFNETGDGVATFFLQNFSEKNAKLKTSAVPFKTNRQFSSKQPLAIGGTWDGLIDDLRLSSAALAKTDLLIHKNKTRPDTLALWRFNKEGFHRDSSPHANHLLGYIPPFNPRHAALTIFCHALLNANEFVYVD